MNPSEKAVLSALSAAKAEYAVVGGVAVIAHGYLRTTRDLYIFIRPTPENAELVLSALTHLHIPVEGLDAGDLLNDEEHLRFPAEEQYVDILSSIGAMPFDQVWRNRVKADVEGTAIPFISKPT